MHIILVSNRLATARTLTITPRLLIAATAALCALIVAISLFFSFVSVQLRLPFAQQLMQTAQEDESRKAQDFVRDNLNAMAVRLGEMQAQVLRLDSLSDRVSSLAGVKTTEKAYGGRGGPLVMASQPLSAGELQRELERLAQQVEQRTDNLTALESRLLEQSVKATLLPSILPIQADYIGSVFGRRIDPLAGVNSVHEGIDFVAPPGTPVNAAAGGVVANVERHAEYGNMVEIDHGNDFLTRYAHLSKFSVKPGQLVKRGQLIAESGNTGRSTGPHLHFEVRYKGVAQNPARFLQQDSTLAQLEPGAAASRRTAAR